MRRLYTRIYVHFLGVLLVVGVAGGLVFAFGARNSFLHDLAQRLTRHVAGLVSDQVGDPAALARLVERLHRDLDVDLTVRDLRGRVLATAGPELPPPTGRERALATEGEIVVRRGPVFRVVVALRAGERGRVVGTLSAATRPDAPLEHLARPALWLAVVLLVVALATWPLARLISRPVERLTAAARRLGEGDLTARVSPEGRRHRRPADELVTLTHAFNEMADRVERLVRGQKVLLANVSHELRSPLARIRVALELLPREGEAERRIRDLERDLADLDRLVEDVLATARLERTGLPAQLGPVEARQLLAEMVDRAAVDPLTSGHEVRLAPGPDVSLLADEALLRRALWNLVENAAKYGAAPITLSAEHEGTGVTFAVTDEGPGIAPDERERVVEPFYRGDAARTPAAPGAVRSGAGLGLTLARRVAEVHGGRLVIGPAKTDGERGCRVALVLPAAP